MSFSKNILFVFFFFYIISLFWRLGDYPLYMEEPRRAVIAIEMQKSDSYLQPKVLGEPYYRKPPLYNWALVSVFKLTGSTANFWVRLISVLSLLILVAQTYYFAKFFIQKHIAIMAAIMMAVSVDIYLYFSRLAEMDLFFSMLCLPVILLPYLGLKKQNLLQAFVLPSFLASIAFLAKGIPAIAFLGISGLVALTLTKKWRSLLSYQFLIGIILFLLPIILYFSLIHYNGGHLQQFFDELLSQSANRTNAEGSFWDLFYHLITFPLATLKILLPFSLILIAAFNKDFYQKMKPLVYLFAANFILYWLSQGARERYIYMLMPLMAIGLAYLADKKDLFQKLKTHKIFLLLTGILLLAVAAIYVFADAVYQFQTIDFVIFIVLVLSLVAFTYCNNSFVHLIALIIIIRLGIDAVQPNTLSYTGFEAYNEQVLGKQLGIELANEKVYYNFDAERNYAFLYELNRWIKQPITKDDAFKDAHAFYIINANQKPKCDYNIVQVWSFGKDNYALIRIKKG